MLVDGYDVMLGFIGCIVFVYCEGYLVVIGVVGVKLDWVDGVFFRDVDLLWICYWSVVFDDGY